MNCQLCDGEGYWIEHQEGSCVITSDCSLCAGTGSLSFLKWLNNVFWHNAPVWFVEWYDKTFN